MYKSIKHIRILIILVMLTGILSFKLIVIKNKFTRMKNQSLLSLSTTAKKTAYDVEGFGYSEILECISKSNDIKVESIILGENDKCSVEVIYSGDTKLLYSTLYYLIESENFLGVSRININEGAKTTNISMDFIKNK